MNSQKDHAEKLHTARYGQTITCDLSQVDVRDRSLPSDAPENIDCSKCVVLILAHSLRTTPLAVEFESPEKEKVVLESNEPCIRALQTFEGETLVARAVKTARQAHAAQVWVMAPGCEWEHQAHAVRNEALAAGAQGVLFYDRREAEAQRLASGNFELCEVPAYALNQGMAKVAVCSQATTLLVMGCEQPRLTPKHLNALVQRSIERPQAEAVASWIVWLRRLPVLITEKLIAELPELMDARTSGVSGGARCCNVVTTGARPSGCPGDSPSGDGSDAHPGCGGNDTSFAPLPQLRVEDVVFGEEKLAPNTATPNACRDFFQNLTLDALGAIRLARALEKEVAAEKTTEMGGGKGNEASAANETETKKSAHESNATSISHSQENKALGAIAQKIASLNDADKLLVSCAQETLAASREVLEEADEKAGSDAKTRAIDAAHLAQADAWAQRNRLDFPLFSSRKQRDRLVFLDSAATAQRCQQSLAAQYDFDAHENANVYRGAYELSMQATFTLNDARKTLEDFIGANRRETIYTANASAGANLIAQAWGSENIHEGDLIVACQCDHHSNMLPWLLLAQRAGARIAYIPCLPDGHLDLQAYREALQQKPRLVCLTHVGNVFGIENPIKEMAAAAKEAGARVFVDGAQAAPHLPVNVKDLGVDFYTLSAHKMYGPMGIGAVWVNPDCYAEMRPAAGGGGILSHESYDSYYLRLGAIGYEVGTPPVSQAVGFAAALNYMNQLGMENIARHSALLTRYLVSGLQRIDGVSIWGSHHEKDGEQGLVSVSVSGLLPGETGAFLGKLGVAVRSGGHCAIPLSALMGVAGTTRISLGVYNISEDIDAALCALRACLRLYRAEFDTPHKKNREDGGAAREVEEARGAEKARETDTPREGNETAGKPHDVKDATSDSNTVASHYATVALNILESLDDDAICGCVTCDDAPLRASEAVELYSEEIRENLPAGAVRASRGCGDPVAKANLQPGERVVDLGCGGGIDALIAARFVGEKGHVYGVDMTSEMIQLAAQNATSAKAGNVTFLQGTIEQLPLPSKGVDVVLSNCVINFSDNKPQVMREAYRVLAPGGRFVVSDIVNYAPISENSYDPLCRIVGCTKGMQSLESYREMLEAAGFEDIRIERKTTYTLDVLREKAEKKGRMAFFQAIENDPAISGAAGSVVVYAFKKGN